MFVFLWSGFLTHSLALILDLFSLLSTFKNIAKTQNVYHNLKPQIT